MRDRKVNAPFSKDRDIITSHQNADDLFFRSRLVAKEAFINRDGYLPF